VNQIKFFLSEGARPSYGNGAGRLAAHTAAFLALSGIADGEAVKRDDAIKILGATAVKYHTSLGNFAKSKTELKLTDKGREFFTLRGGPSEPTFAAYQYVMLTGEPMPDVCANPAFIQPL
jgi:hypothetical protein